MKRVKSLIKLTNLNAESLNEKEQIRVIAGTLGCHCGCWYEYCGGSGDEANDAANDAYGGHSPLEPPLDEAEWGYDIEM